MTRFEASAIMFMVMAIMLILLFGVISIISILNDIKQQHEDIKDNILDDLSQKFENDRDVYLQIVVASSVRLADALIDELQKKGEQNDSNND